MAKTSRNKMKAWRKEAEYVNAKEGTLHNGRKMKAMRKQMEMFMPKFAPKLVQDMLVSVGIMKKEVSQVTQSKEETNEAV